MGTGFSSLVVTLVFAVYAIVLIPSLLAFGRLSDAIGRRRVLIPAVVTAGVGSALFAAASGTGWLFAARAVQGLTLGAVQGTASAALTETDPSGNKHRAALVASIATVSGTAIGPLVTLATGLLPAVRIFAGFLIAAGLVGIVNQVTRPA